MVRDALVRKKTKYSLSYNEEIDAIKNYKQIFKILSEYRKFTTVLLEPEGRLSLLEYFDNDYKITLSDLEKLRIELIYSLDEVKEVILKDYIK